MSNFKGKAAILGCLLSMATTMVIPAVVQAGAWWPFAEREGSCYIPNMQTSFNCQFGPYRNLGGGKQIGGFYVNPTNNLGQTGTIPIAYMINNDRTWRRRQITMNATSGNYIDLGHGVKRLDFKFDRPDRGPLRVGGGTIYFKFNYDVDR